MEIATVTCPVSPLMLSCPLALVVMASPEANARLSWMGFVEADHRDGMPLGVEALSELRLRLASDLDGRELDADCGVGDLVV